MSEDDADHLDRENAALDAYAQTHLGVPHPPTGESPSTDDAVVDAYVKHHFPGTQAA